MALFKFLLASALCVLALAGTPVQLTAANFDELTHIGANSTGDVKPWFIKFYAPWCPHCRKLAPKWDSLVDEVADSVQIGEVDCTKEGDLAKRFHVKGYPTMLLFAEDKMYKYKGGRKVEKLAEFAEGGYASGNYTAQAIPEAANLRGDASKGAASTVAEKTSWLKQWF